LFEGLIGGTPDGGVLPWASSWMEDAVLDESWSPERQDGFWSELETFGVRCSPLLAKLPSGLRCIS
jgi:hypothetical protein